MAATIGINDDTPEVVPLERSTPLVIPEAVYIAQREQ